MRKILLFICFLLLSDLASAQLSTHERPFSFENEAMVSANRKRKIKKITLPSLDLSRLEKEDKEDEEMDIPPRFGYPHKVNINSRSTGTWTELPNGDRLWQLNIVCPGALSINLLYSKFWLPDGGKLFIYTKDKSHYIGAFTSKNNKGDRNKIRGFATGLVYGDDIVLEYYVPKEVTEEAIIAIDYVVHGYKYITVNEKSLGGSGTCQININCPEGQDWQKEKKAVALILVHGFRLCTGALLNTTDFGQEPYLLTANHCIHNYGDAVSSPNLDSFSFMWNYESPGCSNASNEPVFYSTSGASVVANNTTSDECSDFALLSLAEDPQNLSNYTPYYLGWDCTGVSGNPGVCIHHPSGDVKKISTVLASPVSSNMSGEQDDDGNYWRVNWAATQNGHGTTEGGSSGSPLLNSNHKVIGQLFGGKSNCGAKNSPDWYGKFSFSWTGNNGSMYRRLDKWLDSGESGVNTNDGLLVISDTVAVTQSDCQYSNIKVVGNGLAQVVDTIDLGNRSVVVDNNASLIVDGGILHNVNLILRPGSSLSVINGGAIGTSNGFAAPIGTTIYINHGIIQ